MLSNLQADWLTPNRCCFASPAADSQPMSLAEYSQSNPRCLRQIAAASRIPGVTPAAIVRLLNFVRRRAAVAQPWDSLCNAAYTGPEGVYEHGVWACRERILQHTEHEQWCQSDWDILKWCHWRATYICYRCEERCVINSNIRICGWLNV